MLPTIDPHLFYGIPTIGYVVFERKLMEKKNNRTFSTIFSLHSTILHSLRMKLGFYTNTTI